MLKEKVEYWPEKAVGVYTITDTENELTVKKTFKVGIFVKTDRHYVKAAIKGARLTALASINATRTLKGYKALIDRIAIWMEPSLEMCKSEYISEKDAWKMIIDCYEPLNVAQKGSGLSKVDDLMKTIGF